MNRIRIWCPYCKEFESVWPNANHNWVTKRCGGLLRDRQSTEIVGLEGLKKVLVDGIWVVNKKIRKPPIKNLMENSK
jgi:hypothetical protein